MQIFNTIKGIKKYTLEFRCQNPTKKIGFVPTMGFLHEGHLSLIRKAKEISDIVVVSIFVNPKQFNARDDFEKYPMDTERDRNLLKAEGIDALFIPSVSEIYGNDENNSMIALRYDDLMGRLCGKNRPGHFEGVLLIVHNLFQWIHPHYGVFGLKDYQQQLLIKKMVKDLSLDVEIITGALIREPDGLALSSRNARLDHMQRKNALQISRALFEIEKLWAAGSKLSAMKAVYEKTITDLKIDYAGIYDPQTLKELKEDAYEKMPDSVLCAVAAFAGEVRLIDNFLLTKKN